MVLEAGTENFFSSYSNPEWLLPTTTSTGKVACWPKFFKLGLEATGTLFDWFVRDRRFHDPHPLILIVFVMTRRAARIFLTNGLVRSYLPCQLDGVKLRMFSIEAIPCLPAISFSFFSLYRS